MRTQQSPTRLSSTQRDALMDAAKQRALQARREAIDQFWSALGRRWIAAWRALQPNRPHVGCASEPRVYRR